MTLRVRSVHTGVAGSPYYSAFYFSGTGAAQGAIAHERVHGFWTALGGVITTAMTTTTQGDVEEIDEATGQVIAVYPVTPSGRVGGATGDLLPFATQGLIQLRTGTFINGRELRGRIFIPGAVEGAQTTGQPAGAYRTTLQTAADGLVGTTGPQLLIYSRTHRTSSTVKAATAWTQWAVLRSRRD